MYRIRAYDGDRDFTHCRRIWLETGWLEPDAKKEQLDALAQFLSAGPAWVATIDGEAECLAATMPARLRYMEYELATSAVTAVTTSRIARRQGIAGAVTATALAEAAAAGNALAALGIFDQGYYDRLGFGTGPYTHTVAVDPGSILVRGRHRVPVRLTADDWKAMHEARLGRAKRHGAVDLLPDAFTRLACHETKEGFGLGYHSGGRLTHYLWAEPKGEHGPYRVYMLIFQNDDQLVELLSLVQSLAEQVFVVKISEPAGRALQDIVSTPFRLQAQTRNGRYATGNEADAYRQYRILDLAACIAAVSTDHPFSFRLELTDPVEGLLPEDTPWGGVGGSYEVELGRVSTVRRLSGSSDRAGGGRSSERAAIREKAASPEGAATPEKADRGSGSQRELPQVRLGVGALTRLWLGAARAEWLRAIGSITCSRDTAEQLDAAFAVPHPSADWDF